MQFDRRLLLALGALLLTSSLLACGPALGTISLSPSLGPVDPGRAKVLYKPIQGQACGDNALVEALWDMKRLLGVDGYVEVVVEQRRSGRQRCVRVTSYPFTYGSSPKAIQLRGAWASTAPAVAPTVAPAPSSSRAVSLAAPARRAAAVSPPRAPAAAEAAFDCATACARVGSLAGSTALIQRVVAERCVTRCETGDARYQSCIDGVRRSRDVKRCNGLSASRR